VTQESFRRDNHYVSRAYLNRWASNGGRIWTYRVLVSHHDVPLWRESSIKGLVYHTHLYTRVVASGQTDEVEKWLDTEFEAPAEEAIRKATSNARLTTEDWERLVRFLAAQDVRTPARLMEMLQGWRATLPNLVQNTLTESVRELEAAKREGRTVASAKLADTDYLPARVTTEIAPGEDVGHVKVETVAGRGLWLFSLRHLLTQTVKVLLSHKWTILQPPRHMKWITSDDPVIRLNYHDSGKYDFKGGWGSNGTEIFLPLSPRHLLYTKIGERPPPRGTLLSESIADMLRRFCAEHAHRFIFAADKDPDAPLFHSRTVNHALFRSEAEEWKRWHEEQTLAEKELYR
jgi:hypothetical protein